MHDEFRDELSWEPYVGRGVLGGVLGFLAFVLLGAIFVTPRFGSDAVRDLLLVGSVAALLSGALMGLAVGFVIYKVRRKWGKQPGIAVRFMIGFACLLAFLEMKDLLDSAPSSLLFNLTFAILVGGLAGLMARAKRF